MHNSFALEIEDLWKQYRYGQLGAKTLHADIQRFFRKSPKTLLNSGKINTGGIEDRRIGEFFWALKEVNIQIEKGDIVGLIGGNGSGKSTLLKIISRITSPTRGKITVSGRVTSLLEVGTGFHPELTGRENVYLNGSIMGMRKNEISAKLDKIIEFSGCADHIDTPIKRYSSGMIVKLGFSVAAHLECETMIVDEVLAVGDHEFRKLAIEKMKEISRQDGRTILFVSHNMLAVKELCKSGIVIKGGVTTQYKSLNEAINGYLGVDSQHSNAREYPYDGKVPCITQISLNQAENSNSVELKICYKSPYPIKPFPGVVLYTENMQPLTGSDTAMHTPRQLFSPRDEGTIICKFDSFPFHEGVYTASVWLHTAGELIDEKLHAVRLNYAPLLEQVLVKQDVINIGPVNLHGRWELNN